MIPGLPLEGLGSGTRDIPDKENGIRPVVLLKM